MGKKETNFLEAAFAAVDLQLCGTCTYKCVCVRRLCICVLQEVGWDKIHMSHHHVSLNRSPWTSVLFVFPSNGTSYQFAPK